MNHPLISLQDVTIRYPDLTSFEHIHLTINRQQHLALTGENEPLKNALLDALAGQLPILKGNKTFHFYDEYIAAHPGLNLYPSPQKLVALVGGRHHFKNLSNTSDFYYQQRFNSSDSENSLTVVEYLQRIPVFSDQHYWTLENTIERLQLHRLLDEGLIKLSNGETKRVLIAAALLQNPVILLLQNPLAGLDVQSRSDIQALIGQVALSGITLVMSVQPDEIPDTIEQVAIINKEQPFTITPKNKYRLPTEISRPQIVINVPEVKALLSPDPLPTFNSIVEMKAVKIKYGNSVILDDINWTIRQGERWALIGPNGAGKSTLLSLINGDNPQAFANHIILFDRKKGTGESIWEIKKKIGFFSPELFQYFPGETSALQAVESGFYDTIGLFRLSNPRYAATALKWMKILSVDRHASKLLRNLSATDQRLCLLARALVKNPLLLILDEPCQGFSDAQKEHFKHLLNTICSLVNVSLIYVSHYNNEIPECVTQVFRLANGRQVTS